MATSIEMINQRVHDNPSWVKHINMQGRVFIKGTKIPKLWYHIRRTNSGIILKGSYLPSATYRTVKHQIFNNIPIKDIERKLVASRVRFNLDMEEIQQLINELRTISNRKEE